MRKLTALLLACLLLMPCAVAEEAAVNPFLGLWQQMYIISDDYVMDASAEEMYIQFDEHAAAILMKGWPPEEFAYTWSGCTAEMPDAGTTFTLEAGSVLVWRDEDTVLLLMRVDGRRYMQGLFRGDWQVLLTSANPEMHGKVIRFGDDAAICEALNLNWPCIYTKDGCTLTMAAGDAVCAIDRVGMMTIALPDGNRIYLVSAEKQVR